MSDTSQWFLKEGSDLDFIPSSPSLQKMHGKQHKCVQIEHDLFSDEVLYTLDQGYYICYCI